VFLLRYGRAGQDARRFTHNEYLQILSEQGAVGLAAVLLGLIILWRGVLRSRNDRWTWLGPSAALGGLIVHAGTDFVWNVPVIPLVASVLLAAALAREVHDC
jgi:O-antigen ligase